MESRAPLVNFSESNAAFTVLTECAERRGWAIVPPAPASGASGVAVPPPAAPPARGKKGRGGPAELIWTNRSASDARVLALTARQRLNHFPGCKIITRKGSLARTLRRMRTTLGGAAYGFAPRSWVLPAERPQLVAAALAASRDDGARARTYIVKPDHSSEGRGISLARVKAGSAQDAVEAALAPAVANAGSPKDPSAAVLVQEYIERPLLIEGFKFDLRVYVLVTSVHPLRAFVHDEGLVRLCTTQYARPSSSNVGDACMHLTNYTLNKASDAFVAAGSMVGPAVSPAVGAKGEEVKEEEAGVAAKRGEGRVLVAASSGEEGASKRTLPWLRQWLDAPERGFGGAGTATRAWRSVCDVVAKTLIAAQPALARRYASCLPGQSAAPSKCFELFGFDVLLDDALGAHLIEVNNSPSLRTESPLDVAVKRAVVGDLFAVTGFGVQLGAKRGGGERGDVAAARKGTAGGRGPGGMRSRLGMSGAERRAHEAAQNERRRSARFAHEDASCGGFKRVLPAPEGAEEAEHYARYLDAAAAAEAGACGSGRLQ